VSRRLVLGRWQDWRGVVSGVVVKRRLLLSRLAPWRGAGNAKTPGAFAAGVLVFGIGETELFLADLAATYSPKP
jgi:hypothetical protein